MTPTLPSGKATLAEKGDSQVFQKLLSDRHLAFMVMEVVRTRNALLNSDSLIAQAEANPDLDLLEKSTIMDAYKGLDRAEPLFRHVDNAALGDASLRWAGHLPPVAPFAAEEPEKTCPKTCECKGMLMRKDIIHIVKTQYKLDWQPFLDYAESERELGRLPDQSAEVLRSGLEAALNQLNDAFFFKILSHRLDFMGYPHYDAPCTENEQAFYPYLRNSSPLASDVAQGLESGDVFSYSMQQLDVLFNRGREIRQGVSFLRLEIGRLLVRRAEKRKGKQVLKLLEVAQLQFWMIKGNGDTYSVIAMQEWTDILLRMKLDRQASFTASLAIQHCAHLLKEPKAYDTFRRINIVAFHVGQLYGAPDHARRIITAADQNVLKSFVHRSMCQAARAEIVLCYRALRGSGEMKRENLDLAREHYSAAATYYGKAVSYYPSHTPDLGLEDLTLLFRARLKVHLHACKRAGNTKKM